MSTCNSYAAFNETDELKPLEFERRSVGDNDIKIDILFCGVCHSDIHMAHNDWGMSQYPLVPGHEIIGRVSNIGSNVTNFEAGELVGVGCMVDSCRQCTPCQNHQEQFCEQGMIMTYGSPDKHFPDGHITQGGYSTSIVVDQHFVLKIPPNLDTKSGRSFTVRRYHHILATTQVGCLKRTQGRHHRIRWTRTHGC